MECSCSVSRDHGDWPSCYKEIIRTARKEHKCYECYRKILPGEQYEYVSGIWDGVPESYKTCIDCKRLRDVFFSDWTFGMIWEDILNSGVDDIPEKCISALAPITRDKICEMIEDTWVDKD